MRFVVRAQFSTEAGNKMVQNPNMLKDIEEYIGNTKAEASYFFETDGKRTMVFIINIAGADMIPAVAEPLFQKFNTTVEFHPVMLLDDLKNAFRKSMKS